MYAEDLGQGYTYTLYFSCGPKYGLGTTQNKRKKSSKIRVILRSVYLAMH